MYKIKVWLLHFVSNLIQFDYFLSNIGGDYVPVPQL